MMEVNQGLYLQFKREVQGFYFKFNTQVLRYYIHKMFNYDNLLSSTEDFSNFTDFYNFHTKNKQNLIEGKLELMYQEAQRKGLNPTRPLVQKCLIVRLGNIYNGMSSEKRILDTFKNLSPYITCEKTPKEIDMLYKVDAIIELQSVDKLAIQIKPLSFTSYDNGSEIEFHKKFETEFGMKVCYVFYKDNFIKFNNVEILLNNKEKIIDRIEKLLIGG